MCVYYCMATYATLTQILGAITIFLVSQQEYEDIVHNHISFGLEFVTRNILSTTASIILSVYNILFTCKLSAMMKKHSSMKREIRLKLILQAIMIQVVLTVRILKVWLQIEMTDELLPVYLIVMIIQFISSGVLPFTWFSWTIAKQLLASKKQMDPNL